MSTNVKDSTLLELWQAGANEYAYQDRAQSLPLLQLCRELQALLSHLEKENPELYGSEGISRMYQYGLKAYTGANVNGVELRDHVKISELRYRWIAVFPVTGGNEGHYVHVEIIYDTDEYREGHNTACLFLCKTFNGLDSAIAISAALCKALGV